jgi:hypothetical protein
LKSAGNRGFGSVIHVIAYLPPGAPCVFFRFYAVLYFRDRSVFGLAPYGRRQQTLNQAETRRIAPRFYPIRAAMGRRTTIFFSGPIRDYE